jgi:hypothetical protein
MTEFRDKTLKQQKLKLLHFQENEAIVNVRFGFLTVVITPAKDTFLTI